MNTTTSSIDLSSRNHRCHNGMPTRSRSGFTKSISAHSKKSSEVRQRFPSGGGVRSPKCSLDNEIDGSTLLKLSEAMVVRLFPTIKLEVQFLDLLQSLKQRSTTDINPKKTLASSSSTIATNGHNGNRTSAAHQIAAHVLASTSSVENGIEHSSNSNSPVPTATNGHHNPRVSYSERSQIPQRLTPKAGPPLKTLKREPKFFATPTSK